MEQIGSFASGQEVSRKKLVFVGVSIAAVVGCFIYLSVTDGFAESPKESAKSSTISLAD